MLEIKKNQGGGLKLNITARAVQWWNKWSQEWVLHWQEFSKSSWLLTYQECYGKCSSVRVWTEAHYLLTLRSSGLSRKGWEVQGVWGGLRDTVCCFLSLRCLCSFTAQWHRMTRVGGKWEPPWDKPDRTLCHRHAFRNNFPLLASNWELKTFKREVVKWINRKREQVVNDTQACFLLHIMLTFFFEDKTNNKDSPIWWLIFLV